MKRLIILPCLLICVALFATVTALMQDQLRSHFNISGLPQTVQAPNALPQTHLNQNRLHKLIVKSEDSAVYEELTQRNAIRREFDYGSFKLVEVDQDAMDGRAALQAMPVTWRDDQDMILFNGYLIDTSAQQPLSKEPPADLKQPRMAEARARGDKSPGRGLYVVHFAGPIKGEWLDELKNTGAKVVSYVANNAYVLDCDARSAALISRMPDELSYVQWAGDYHGAYKLDPTLTAARTMDAAASVRVTAQLLDNEEGNQWEYNLRSNSRQFISESRVMNYRNLTAVIPISQ